MSNYKDKGESPGGAARYYEPGGIGWYTYLWCGGCQHTREACNVQQAKEEGWRKRKEWGWLCAGCLIRLNLSPRTAL